MPEFIRVRVKATGVKQTIAKPETVDPEVYEVLDDEDAVDYNDRIIPPEVPEDPGYTSMKVDDLKTEIDSRNQGRGEADLIPTVGNKPDLIAALEADDNREGELS